MKPSTLNYDGLDVHLLPWINPENYNHSMEFIRKNAEKFSKERFKKEFKEFVDKKIEEFFG